MSAGGPAVRAVLIGGAGASLAAAAGLPAAPLIGASLAVSVAALARLHLRMPRTLRDAGFLGIGLSLGSGVGPETFDALGTWSLSLGLLVLSLAATLGLGRIMLGRVFGMDRQTATLASSPGTMSYALALADDLKGDVTAVLIVQSLRLLLLASALPVFVHLLVLPPAGLAPRPELGWLPLGGLALVAALAGRGLERLGLPAAWLIAGFAVSAGAHLLGSAHGTLPVPVAFACFTLTGTTIGTRFSGIALHDLRRCLGAALALAAAASAVSLAFAAVLVALTGLPLGQAWVAFAPGGVEAMAAVGVALGYDPAFVALHHLVRIGALMVLVPIFLRR